MPLLYSLLFLSINLFASVQTDRVYAFVQNTKEDRSDDKRATNFGLLVEGSTELFDSEIIGSVRFLHDEELLDESYDSADIKELYIKKYFSDDIYSFTFGREVTSFGVAKTYSLLDFFTKKNAVTNSNDKSLELLGSDGVNIVYEDEYKVAIYSYDVNKGSANNIFEVSKMFDSYNLSLYLNQDLEAFTASFSLNDYFNLNSEFKNENNKFDMILGIDYTPISEVLITLEKLYLNSGENKEERLTSLKNISSKTKNEKDKYFNSLTSKEYTNIYLKYSKDDIDTSFYISINDADKSKRYLSQLKYSYDSYSFLVEYLVNAGKNNSEYSDTLIKDKISFHISWRYN